jgi:hypothetical protein
VDRKRFEELEAKAASEGLTDEEAAELGRLYAEEAGEPYEDASSMKDSESEDEESQKRRELDAAQQAAATAERDRSQALTPGVVREPDYKEKP